MQTRAVRVRERAVQGNTMACLTTPAPASPGATDIAARRTLRTPREVCKEELYLGMGWRRKQRCILSVLLPPVSCFPLDSASQRATLQFWGAVQRGGPSPVWQRRMAWLRRVPTEKERGAGSQGSLRRRLRLCHHSDKELRDDSSSSHRSG